MYLHGISESTSSSAPHTCMPTTQWVTQCGLMNVEIETMSHELPCATSSARMRGRTSNAHTTPPDTRWRRRAGPRSGPRSSRCDSPTTARLSRVALTAQPLRLAPRESTRPATSGRRVLPSTLIDGRALAHHSRLLERGHLDVELLAPGGLHLLATRRRRRQLNDRSIVLLLLMLGQLELANEAVVGHLWQQPTRHTRPSVASVGAIRRTRRHIRGN